jgi:1-acyl-sn-glycerol-3-phosphate acyltransferase
MTPTHEYSLPLPAVIELSFSVMTGIPRRNLAADSRRMLDLHTPRPTLTGAENLPRTGAFMVVANHYQRKGLWIGWVGALIAESIHTIRPAPTPIRIVVTDVQMIKLAGKVREFPTSRWFMGRVAKFWGMIRMPAGRSEMAKSARARALENILAHLDAGEPVLYFPEGTRGNAKGLVPALPNTGNFMRNAAQRAQIVPVAFWEEGANGEQLRGHVGAPIQITGTDDSAIREQVMVTIGKMLPRHLWGHYADKISNTSDSK